MTSQKVNSSAEALNLTRPWQDSFRQILGAGITLSIGILLLLILPVGEVTPSQAWDTAAIAGKEILNHIGWVFGVHVPVLLSFYAIVIGGQFITDLNPFSTRRTLGTVAQVIAATFIPVLLLVLVACIYNPNLAGALVVIAPTSGLTFFLAVQLGSFTLPDYALKLQDATRKRIWASERLRTLRRRGRRPLWAAQLLNAAVLGVVGCLIHLCFAMPRETAWSFALAYFLISTGLVMTFAGGVLLLASAQDRPSRVLAWVLPISGVLLTATLATACFMQGLLGPGLGLTTILLLGTLSTLWSRRYMNRFFLDWTLQGAGSAYAAARLARQYVKATREIQELNRSAELKKAAPFRDRISAALRALWGS